MKPNFKRYDTFIKNISKYMLTLLKTNQSSYCEKSQYIVSVDRKKN